MADMKKVIKGLEACYRCSLNCEDCPYNDLKNDKNCNDTLGSDAISILKEQEQTIENLKERLRLLDYANRYPMQDILMPAT